MTSSKQVRIFVEGSRAVLRSAQDGRWMGHSQPFSPGFPWQGMHQALAIAELKRWQVVA